MGFSPRFGRRRRLGHGFLNDALVATPSRSLTATPNTERLHTAIGI
jgi:hypothetical protein